MKITLLLFKGVVSLLFLWLAFSKVHIGEIIRDISHLPFLVISQVLFILFIQFVIGSFRQITVLSLVGETLGFVESFRTYMIGAFFSQTPISFLGGDAMRIWSLKKMGLRLHAVASAIFLERIFGLLVIIVLVAVVLPNTLPLIQYAPARWSLISLAGVGVLGCVAFLLLGFLPSHVRDIRFIGPMLDFASVSRYVRASPSGSLKLFTHSLVIQLINVLAIYFIGLGFGLTITLWQCMILIPPVLFLAMLPISIAGWGVREGAMVVAFGYVGIHEGGVLLTSVTFGLALLIVSLIGAPLWFLNEKHEGKEM